MTKKAAAFARFAGEVMSHINGYVVPQYGDDGDDLASEYTADECVKQIEKYAKRFGRSSRPGERKRDLMKIAHYAQMAFDKVPD